MINEIQKYIDEEMRIMHKKAADSRLRDQFAMAALEVIDSNCDSPLIREVYGHLATRAYIFADAMMKAREAE